MNSQYSNLFGAYNARHLDPVEVAETFVPPKKFWGLLKNGNHLLIGPRGSGKTTLLKMLQPAALSAWDSPAAAAARSQIQFVGVFVPTDLNWSEEISVAVSVLPMKERNVLEEALLVANVQLALVTTLMQLAESTLTRPLAECYIPITRGQEAAIAAKLEQRWRFPDELVEVQSFRSLRSTILQRIGTLSSYRPNMPDAVTAAERIRHEISISQFNFETTLIEAIDIIESVTETARRWGILFDELELASPFLQTFIFRRLRSARSERVLYKLAVVPHVPAAEMLNQVNTPGVTNDWIPIPLWYTDQRDVLGFCRDLWTQVVCHVEATGVEPLSVFGSSHDEELAGYSASSAPPATRPGKYRDKSTRQREFASLYQKDPTFKEYLRVRGIVPDGLNRLPARVMDSTVRKIAPLVAYRDQLIDRFDGQQMKRRPKRVLDRLYSGWESICIVSEGNPRWFRSIIDALLSDWQRHRKSVGRNTQYSELERASRRFRALIAACPVGDVAASNKDVQGPLDFVQVIARFQQDRLLDYQFKADMPLTFECDEHVDEALLHFLSACLNVGAVISADDEDAALSLSALRGRTFRLSYLLAPSLELPLRTGKARAMSTIFSKTSVERFKKALPEPSRGAVQPSLWD
jgi:energy-coupling factor transporter ATP-binding protein EcfA2